MAVDFKEQVKAKIDGWYRDLQHFRTHKDDYTFAWVHQVVDQCDDNLAETKTSAVAETVLDFLHLACTDADFVLLCFSDGICCALCTAMKRLLARHSRDFDFRIKALQVLISLLQTADEALRAEFPIEGSREKITFGNVPWIMEGTDVDYFVLECFKDPNVELVNKASEFFLYYFLTFSKDIKPQVISNVLETALNAFNLVFNELSFDKPIAVQLISTIVKPLPEVGVTFQEKIVALGWNVIGSKMWDPADKIDCIKLMEICKEKMPAGCKKLPKIVMKFASFAEETSLYLVDTKSFVFFSFFFKKDLKSSVVNIPEFDHVKDPKEAGTITQLLYSIVFNLQNLLFKITDPKKVRYIWDLSHEILAYLLRLCKSDMDSVVFASYLKNIVLHGTTLFTIQTYIIGTMAPKDICIELVKYLSAWTEAISLMTNNGRPMLAESLPSQGGRILKTCSMAPVLMELEHWLDLVKPHISVGDETAAGEEKKKLFEETHNRVKDLVF